MEDNQTILSDFILLGLSDLPNAQHSLFLLLLLIYLMTLTGNLLILLIIFLDSHLHTPMYFFLANLASLDICYSQVTLPKLLLDFFIKKQTISIASCIAQIFFLHFSISSELFLLAVMSYDRYIAICHPLHYIKLMQKNICTQLACLVWLCGFLYSLVQILCTLRLSFCRQNFINNLFCDLPQLLQLSCTETLTNILVILIFGGILGFCALGVTFFPYVYIFKTVQKIKTKQGKTKAFSTCTSHLSVVFTIYAALIFTYFRPTTDKHFEYDKLVSVLYAVITPLLNPIIYSLRNNDLKRALSRVLHKSSFHVIKPSYNNVSTICQ
ncbi:olfactory receptor 1G1 [Xenopus laevis]|uniref:Olfactory receptor n=2 Tax=Xenopus laevis TaxID=8355 RepID=A0A974HMN7_XENLA|nr:olfactory receptor 1G1 [Xenopus laevis]OCT83296.1 hypothetical protein XELAEV_18025833mg [Xenopus laevis]